MRNVSKTSRRFVMHEYAGLEPSGGYSHSDSNTDYRSLFTGHLFLSFIQHLVPGFDKRTVQSPVTFHQLDESLPHKRIVMDPAKLLCPWSEGKERHHHA